MVTDMSKQDADYISKVVLMGRGRVGKTTFATRFVDGCFREDYKMTIGVSHSHKVVSILEDEKKVGSRSVKLVLWDLAGQRRFRDVIPGYCSSADAVLFFCSLQDPETELIGLTSNEREAFIDEESDSIKEIKYWAPLVKKNAPQALKYLVATKLDLIPEGRKASKIEEILTQSKNTFGFGGTELLTKQEFGQRMRTALSEQVFDFYPYDLDTTKFKAMNLEDQMELSILRFPVYFVSSKTGYNVGRVMQDVARGKIKKAKIKRTFKSF
ncbi:MAG: hypothetical protein GOU97_02000 [Nanoarchaeota archaeon]|nr:hypothetical protein [Nanoarchaeota archaeon]